MNIWSMLLFYIYSGIAFGALVHARGGILLSEAMVDEQTHEDMRKEARSKIVKEAMTLGDHMNDAVQAAWTGSYNSNLLNVYERQKQAEAQLNSVVPAPKGS